MSNAKFAIGQIVEHKLFDYRGVVVDVDFRFLGSNEWYESVALSRPPKHEPWYHVLVDGSEQQTYVAEQNLFASGVFAPIEHPRIDAYFEGLGDSGYILPVKKAN